MIIIMMIIVITITIIIMIIIMTFIMITIAIIIMIIIMMMITITITIIIMIIIMMMIMIQTLTTKDCKGLQTNMPKNVGSTKTYSAKLKSRYIKFCKQNTAMLIVLREN